MDSGIEVDGMDELIEKLQAMDSKADLIVNDALNAGAKIILDNVKPKIPRSNLDKEHAADHIEISKVKKQDGVPYVLVGPNKGDTSKFFYLKFIEWGTVKMAARAPFGRTIAEEKDNVRNAMVKTLKEGLEL
jgi:HK97 gp10 family phage protein